MLRPALVLAALADSLTFLLLPTGAELNPLAASNPYASLVAKFLLATILLAWPWRYASRLRAIGAFAWSVGALSNLAVLL